MHTDLNLGDKFSQICELFPGEIIIGLFVSNCWQILSLYFFYKFLHLFCKQFFMLARNSVFFLYLYSRELFCNANLVKGNSEYHRQHYVPLVSRNLTLQLVEVSFVEHCQHYVPLVQYSGPLVGSSYCNSVSIMFLQISVYIAEAARKRVWNGRYGTATVNYKMSLLKKE